MLPQIPQEANDLIQDQNGQLSTFPFPPNVAGDLSKKMRQRIYRWMLQKYIWPQIMQRKPYEAQWNKLLDMALAQHKVIQLSEEDESTRLARQRNVRILNGTEDAPLKTRLEVADTVIFDAVDRQTNLNHFVAFKDSLPVQYQKPEDMVEPYANEVYGPMDSMIKSANCWMKMLARNENVYRKGWMQARHHYSYGVSFLDSQFRQKIEPVLRRQPDKSFKQVLELTDIAVSFEGISIRKLWLNPKLSPYDMKYQHCPFFYEEMPRFAIVANPYDQEANPFGYSNLDNLPEAQYLFSAEETSSFQDAFKAIYPNVEVQYNGLLDPALDVELLWTFYAMLPIIDVTEIGSLPPTIQQRLWDKYKANPDLVDEGYMFDDDGTLHLPLKRYIVQTFGNNLCGGNQEIVRLQRNFYPHDNIPLTGSAHMPSLDAGTYCPAIGTILENHYNQICKCMAQYIDNKDWANDPPTTVVIGSPAMNKDLNRKGSIIPVNTHEDVSRREVADATQTTPQMLGMLREQAQTSSKSTDAILGKAMGSRTTALEANNVFTTAMSGITTDVNLFSYDTYGVWAQNVWDYTGRWVDPDLLARVTGSYGFALRPEHLTLRIGLKTDIGSTFIESITRQQNLRYVLESSAGDPSINRPYLWKALFREWKWTDAEKIVTDGGLESTILIATEQAIQGYMGNVNVMIDPSANHQIAMKVKTSFLADHKSIWNTQPQYVANVQNVVNQIMIHQQWIQLQQMQMMMQQRQQMLGEMEQQDITDDSRSLQRLQRPGPTNASEQSQHQGRN